MQKPVTTHCLQVRSAISYADLAKRALDIVASLLGLVLLAPLFAILAVLIKRESPGPVFYRGIRLGKGGKLFSIHKFRTMHEAPESYQGARLTARDDPRVTPFGRWLRDRKLNELPQLWNVLTGEMSLVGPRPEDPEIASAWPEEARGVVLSVRPGLTSPASLHFRNEEYLLRCDCAMQTYLGSILPTKLCLDQQYVRCRSLWLDLLVLFSTVLALRPKSGKTRGTRGLTLDQSSPRQSEFLGAFKHSLSHFFPDRLP